MSCLCAHLHDGLQFVLCCRAHAVKSLTKVCSVIRAIHDNGPITPLPHFGRCASSNIPKITEYLYICCTTEAASGYLSVTAWYSDFSDVSSCVQDIRNTAAGTSAFLVYTEAHRLLSGFAQHCTHPRSGGSLHRQHLGQTGVARKHTT